MKKKIRFNVSKTKSYRCGFPHELLLELRQEANSRGVSLSMHIQEILERDLAVRLSELIKQSMKNSIEYEYTSFVITEDFFKMLADASKSVKLNVPELCRDVLANRHKQENEKNAS